MKQLTFRTNQQYPNDIGGLSMHQDNNLALILNISLMQTLFCRKILLKKKRELQTDKAIPFK